MKIMLIALGVVFGGILAFNLIKSLLIKHFFANYQPPAVTVSTVLAKDTDWQPQLHAVANFVASNGVEVNAQISGNVTGMHFEAGQFVKKDDVLVDIDDSVEQATLKANQSELALQEINYKRQTDLFKRNATPGSSVDEAKAKLLQAQAEVEKTQAIIRQKHPAAPFSGKLGIGQVNLGEYVTPGQTSLVSLQALDPIYLDFFLPEQLLPRLHIGQRINFHVEQNPNSVFTGKISAINVRVDINTHNVKVRATVANCPMQKNLDSKPQDNKNLILCNTDKNNKNNLTEFNFIPGMFAAVDIEEPVQKGVVFLPATAISYSLYGNSVYVVEKDKTDPKIQVVKRVFVTTGDEEGNNIVIKKGIKPGQEVVSFGELKLQDGTRVVINNSTPIQNTSSPDLLDE